MHREFNDAETTLHRKFGAHARNAAVDAGLLVPPDAPLLPAVLDELWDSWEWSDDMSDEDQKVAIALFGFALGDHIAAETGMKWRIASDEQGSDYALVLPGTDITAFPLATVAKRLGEASFFESMCPAMIREIKNAPRERKPWWKVW